MALVVKISVGFLLMSGIVYCLKVVPERVVILFKDMEEFGFSNFYVTRHGRKSDYLLNLEGSALKPWYNNVTIHLVFYEYLHNEYRRSFVEMKNKFCDWLKIESYVGGMFKKNGVFCPALGEYHLMNMTFPTENFPYVFPFEKFRVDAFINKTNNGVMMWWAQVYAHFARK